MAMMFTNFPRRSIRLFRRLLLGKSAVDLLARVETLEHQVSHWNNLVERLNGDAGAQWLYKGREERMDAMDDLFDETRREFHLARYRFACERVARLRVADIACGTGYGTELLKQQGDAMEVTGIDIDKETIDYARVHHMPPGTEFVCASADRTGLDPQSYDAIISFETIEHVPSDTALLSEFYGLLKPKGLFICSTPNDWPISVSPYHVRTYDLDAFKSTLCVYFDQIELFNQNSGSETPYNHNQVVGICKTTATNQHLAECYIAVCRRRATLDGEE